MYLLSIEELNSGPDAESLFACALRNMDDCRLEKVRRLKNGGARNLAAGAGLLLQLAVRREKGVYPACFTVSEALDVLDSRGEPVRIAYRYGTGGKPDFAEGTLHFSLSHSEQYVCCAVAGQEIGVDIQRMRPLKNMRIAERFFSRRERELLESCQSEGERQELFYRIWVRKEAYAKLTGAGIAAVIGRESDCRESVRWQEFDRPRGYRMAVCLFGREGAEGIERQGG